MGRSWLTSSVLMKPPKLSIATYRGSSHGNTYLGNFVTAEPWALTSTSTTGPAAAVQLLALSAQHARVETRRDLLGHVLAAWPAGSRALLRFTRDSSGRVIVAGVDARHEPAPMPYAAEELADLDTDNELAHGQGTPEDAAPEARHELAHRSAVHRGHS